jgi:isoleucyl-tRNA synthetase
LNFWNENKIFEKSTEREPKNGSFVFYDGPPFATGTPHYGHLLASVIKDAIPRYQTMQGKRVLRRWGWDCHGLPLENIIEKELDLKTKKDILDYGLDKFNQKAREAVLRYAHIWEKVVHRAGRFVDMENDYRTMDKTYTESVWWSFKELYNKNLAYKSFKSMHLCPRCETTLSNFEVNQGYKDITDISVFVEFELVDEPNTFLLAWTTTPWTLPGNVALAVNPDMEYVEVSGEVEGNKYILAKSRVEAVFKENFKILRSVPSSEIIGKKYKPLFDYYSNDPKLENKENGWMVYAGDFVIDTEGTGIVHIAPAFGEEDYNLAKENNLPFVQHVGTNGLMKKEVLDFFGLPVKPKSDEKDGHQKTDIEIIKYLAGKNVLFGKEKIVHSYPHCWRCDTPLLNYATSSWFVKVTDLKEKMLEENKKVNWLPKEIGQNRFGNWIEGARDWAISRARFWGAPLPVWVNDAGKTYVIGGVDELKKRIPKRNNYFLVRHGESEGNAKGDLISSNVFNQDHLTSVGIEEAKKAGIGLNDKKIDIIVSSPFLRTKETSENIAKEIGFSGEIVFDDRLVEIKAGEFDGNNWKDYPWDYYFNIENQKTSESRDYENIDSIRQRIADFLYDIDSKYEGKNIVIVSHGAPLKLLDLVCKGMSKREMIKHYYDDSFFNAEVREVDFRQFPKNENFEIDLHRPFIDNVELLGDDGEKLTRIPDVFDCWYESGSMFFAQNHYPFENKEDFEKNHSLLFPADFIAEGLDQTRGWFYTLLALGVGLFGKSPYKNVVVNGLVLAEDGRKMSKKLKNYPDLMETVNKYGVDSIRFFLLSSPAVKSDDFSFKEKGVDEISKKIVLKLSNVYSFYEMYKDESLNGFVKKDCEENVLDTWIVNNLYKLRNEITEAMDKYELDKATKPILDFVDDFSTWYIRRSRERFKSENLVEKNTALFYTRFILVELSKLLAPFMPFTAEDIYQKLKDENSKESVHLDFWPEAVSVDFSVLEKMAFVREVVSMSLMEREKSKIKVRQPLGKLKIKNQKLKVGEEYMEIIKDEVNVKIVVFDDGLEGLVWLDTEITSELKEEGIAREVIRAVQDLRKKMNLVPKDVVSLAIHADEKVKKSIEKYQEKISKTVGAKDIVFTDSELENKLSVDDNILSFNVSKL